MSKFHELQSSFFIAFYFLKDSDIIFVSSIRKKNQCLSYHLSPKFWRKKKGKRALKEKALHQGI